MGDKSKNGPHERTVWVQPDVTPGSSVRWGNWEDREDLARRCGNCYGSGKVSDRSWRDVRCDVCRGSGRVKPLPMTIIESGSDYSGTLVEKSNAECLQRDFPWLVELHGGHGTFGVAYLGRRENQNPALLEAIDSLTESCIYDEDHHTEMEHDRENDAWADYGRRDFKKAIVKFFDESLDEEHEHDEDSLTDDAVDTLWWDCTEKLNGGESFSNQQGDSICFPIDHVIDSIERNWPGIDSPHFAGERPTIREQLNALCDASAVHDDVCRREGCQ